MRIKQLCLTILVLTFLIAIPVQSAIVIARSDEAMIRTAPAIVTGTVVEVYPRQDDHGDIETVTRILVSETIKGGVPVGEIVDVVQFGGYLDGRFQAQSGAPRYEVGARYLVVLDRNGRGQWTTFDLALGQFRFVTRNQKQLLVRDTHEVTGWTESGEAFHDHDRSAAEFLSFARDVVKTTPQPPRIAGTAFHPVPLTLDYDLKSTSQSVVGTWNGGASAMADGVSATPASGDTKNLNDCESRVIADDPHGDVAGSCCPGIVATAFFGCGSPCGTCATSIFNGETYLAIEMADIVVNDGVSSATLSSGNFLTAMVHEFGHTWGFRHSDQDANGGACALPLPCTSNAIMNSGVVNGLNGVLQSWDQDAANEVYGNGTRQASFTGAQYVYPLGPNPSRRPASMSWRISQAPCTAPSITTQPQSQSISSGSQANLSVVASGAATLTYQWYRDAAPAAGGTLIAGATSAVFHPSPAVTTSYWVRVSNSCNGVQFADSNPGAVVTVTCAPPSVPTPLASPSSISSGQSSILSASPTGSGPFTYQWYIGNSGDTSNSIAGATNSSTSVSPTVTTNYWVKVTGQCGTFNSPATTVTVACTPIAAGGVGAQPPTINVGQSSTISVTTSGSGPFTFQWYRGSVGDFSNPIATTSSTLVSPTTSTTYWVRVTASCGSQDGSVTVFVNAPCTQSSITTNPAFATIAPGGSATLTVVAAGTAPISYQWYTGTSGNTGSPIAGATNASITVSPTVTTSYWVRVSNSCNTIGNNSTTALVTVSANCNAATITTQPANVSAGIGTAATLKVVATVAGTTIHYQWYKGAKGDLSTKVGTDSDTFSTGTVSVTASYWVRLTSACNPLTFIDSNAAIVTSVLTRRHAVLH